MIKLSAYETGSKAATATANNRSHYSRACTVTAPNRFRRESA